MAAMTLVHAVTGIVVFVVVVGIIGYALADYLDKKYGTDASGHPAVRPQYRTLKLGESSGRNPRRS